MNDTGIKNLIAAITLQAVRDYFQATDDGKQFILVELRSPWMQMLTNGQSVVVAEQLEKHPEEIAARLRQHKEIGGLPI